MDGGEPTCDLDPDAAASAELPRSTRLALILSGLLILALVWPVGFAALVISGGGHGSPFDGGTAEFAMGVALLAVPAIMLAVGIACLACTSRARLRVVAVLALAFPMDLVVAFVAGAFAMRSPDPRSYAIPASTAAPQVPMVGEGNAVAAPGGTTVSIACDPTTRACTATTQPAEPAPPRSAPPSPNPK